MCVGIIILTFTLASAQRMWNVDSIKEHYAVQHPAEFERAYRINDQKSNADNFGAGRRHNHRNEDINRPGFNDHRYGPESLIEEHHRQFHHHPHHYNVLVPPPSLDLEAPKQPVPQLGLGELERPPLQVFPENRSEETPRKNGEQNGKEAESHGNINENKTRPIPSNVTQKQQNNIETVNQNVTNSHGEDAKNKKESDGIEKVGSNSQNSNFTGTSNKTIVTTQIVDLEKSDISRNTSNNDERKQERSKTGTPHEGKAENTTEEEWSWGIAEATKKVTTVSTNNVTLDDRAAFDGGQCATGMARVFGKCVEKD